MLNVIIPEPHDLLEVGLLWIIKARSTFKKLVYYSNKCGGELGTDTFIRVTVCDNKQAK